MEPMTSAAANDRGSVPPALAKTRSKASSSVRFSLDLPAVVGESSGASPLRKPQVQASRRNINGCAVGASQALLGSSGAEASCMKTGNSSLASPAANRDSSNTAIFEPWDISRINKPWEIDKELRRSLPVLARAKRNDRESAADKFLRLSKLPLPAAPGAESMLLDIATPQDHRGSQRSLTLTSETKAKYFGAGAKTECHAIFRKLAAQKYLTNQPLSEFLDEQQERDEHETALLGPRTTITPLPLGHHGSKRIAIATSDDTSGPDPSDGSEMQQPVRSDAEALAEQYHRQQQQQRSQRQFGRSALSRLDSATLSSKSIGDSGGASAVNLFANNFHQADRSGLFSRQFTARHKFSALCLENDLPPCIRLIVRNYFSPEINVSHMAIGDDLACVFAQCLQDLPMVTGLNARNNRLGDRGLRALIDVVVAKRDLYHLDLSENKVDGAAAAALATYLGSTTCALQTLRLSRADVDDTELAPFAHALHSNRSLQTLDLSRNLAGSTENLNVVRPSIVTGGEALATMLSINSTLTCLDLSWNYLRLGGAVELGKSLAFNTGLRELNLAYNALGNAGAQALGESLLANTSLERLDVSNNNIPAHGAQAVASAIKRNTTIVRVNFDGNPLGQTGGRALLHAVAACTDRQLAISMEGCNFDLSDADGFDPAEATGTYDLDMAVPYERAIALELLRVANTRQGCKFLSIVHVNGKVRRNIKVELREVDGSDAHRHLLKTAGILTDSEADENERRAHHLDRTSLVTLFHELDADDSGFVDDIELTRGMRQLGLAFRDEDVPRFIAQYDLDGTGTIDLEEFVELMSSFELAGDGHVGRECVDIATGAPFTIPTDGRLQIDFVDFHVSADHDNAHSHAGVERLIANISASANKSQMLTMAKSGLVFRAAEAQLLLEAVADVCDTMQAVMALLPNMVDAKHAHALIDSNLSAAERVRMQHLLGHALAPMLGLSTGHYRLDLGHDLDRLTLKKLVENSNRTAFLRKKAGLKDTSQHGNHHGFRNEVLHGKPVVLAPAILDGLPKFGVIEFDYVQIGRAPGHAVSTTRFEQILAICQLEHMGPTMGVRTAAAPRTGTSSSSSSSRNGNGSKQAAGGSRTSSPAKRESTGSGSKGGPRSSATDTTEQSQASPFPPLRQFTRVLYAELESMKSVKGYVKFGDGLNCTVDLTTTNELQSSADGVAGAENAAASALSTPLSQSTSTVDGDSTDADATHRPMSRSSHDANDDDDDNDNFGSSRSPDKRTLNDSDDRAAMVIERGGRATCTARRLLFTLQWLLAMRWVTAQQAVRLLSLWPVAFAASRVDVVCILFDRLADLHNVNGVLAALTDAEAAQCFYRFGWLNVWTPLLPDNYYELSLAVPEEREVAKSLVRLAIDEPGENWQRETFGWSRDELIPGWELNMSWLKDGGFPEKGYLCLEYYSGADEGCGPVWPTRRELAAGTLCGLPEADMDELITYVDSLSRQPGGVRRV